MITNSTNPAQKNKGQREETHETSRFRSTLYDLEKENKRRGKEEEKCGR